MANRVIVWKNNKLVASAKNLEVLSRYHRQSPVKSTSIKKLPDGAVLKVYFSDGAWAIVNFASYDVLQRWLDVKKKRSGW